MSATIQQQLKHDPRKLTEALFNRAKLWWGLSLTLKVCSLIIGVGFALIFPSFEYGALITLGVYAAAECVIWRSDVLKSLAESIKRKVEFQNAFGWSISRAEISDLLASRIPSSIKKKIPPPNDTDNYFASHANPGPSRALENTQESAWWSWHLATFLWKYCFGLVAILIIISIIVLLITLNAGFDHTKQVMIGRIVTATLTLLFSIGIARLGISYYNFNKQSENTVHRTELLIERGCDEISAIKTLHEYQLARSTAPFIPSWLHWLKNTELNNLWEDYRKDAPSCSETDTNENP